MKISVSALGNRIIELESDDVALVLGSSDRNKETIHGGPVVYLGLNPEYERVLMRTDKGVVSESVVYLKSLHALSADPQFREKVTELGMKSLGLEKVSIN